MKATDGTINNPNAEAQIIGKWNWKETILNFEGVEPPHNRVSPETEGYTEQRWFLPNGKVEFYRNGSLTGTYSYKIEYAGEYPEGEPFIIIKVDNTQWWLKVHESNLMIRVGGAFGSCGEDNLYEKIDTAGTSDA